MSEPTPTPPWPARPPFGFLLGGTILGTFFGCILICAGANPPHLIIIGLSICGALTGGVLEASWPKTPRPNSGSSKLVPPAKLASTDHECQHCGEVFPPQPVVCPMCGKHDGTSRT